MAAMHQTDHMMLSEEAIHHALLAPGPPKQTGRETTPEVLEATSGSFGLQ